MPGEGQPATGQAAEQRGTMMPFMMGMPWVQRFGGSGSEAKLGEWQAQMETMLSFQPISDAQKADMIMSFLDGEAKREVLTLEKTCRDTPRKIFSVLSTLYGDSTHVSVLRAQFFNCRQEPNQSLRSFSLHLRELFLRLKRKDETGLERGDVLLRDQFIMGLREGPIKQELRRQVRKQQALSFDEVKFEALALEGEQDDNWPAGHSCLAVSRPNSSPQNSVADWKQEFRRELLKEVKEQLTETAKILVNELRAEINGPSYPPVPTARPRAYSDDLGRVRQRFRTSSNNQDFKWDPHGRPICNQCGEPGHIRRHCPQTKAPQGF